MVGLLTPYMIILGVLLFGKPREYVLDAFSSIWVAPFVLGFVMISLIHMRIGMNVIIEDYIHHKYLKYSLFTLNWMFTWGTGLVIILSLLKMFIVSRIS